MFNSRQLPNTECYRTLNLRINMNIWTQRNEIQHLEEKPSKLACNRARSHSKNQINKNVNTG